MLKNIHLNKENLLTAADITLHLVLAIILAGFFRVYTGGWLWPILAVTGGVLIDLDHFLDYFLHYGLKLNLGDFFCYRYKASGKCYIILHSWEVIALLWILSLAVRWIVPLVSGMTLHLVTDQAWRHEMNLSKFSLYCRWKHGFELDKIWPKK